MSTSASRPSGPPRRKVAGERARERTVRPAPAAPVPGASAGRPDGDLDGGPRPETPEPATPGRTPPNASLRSLPVAALTALVVACLLLASVVVYVVRQPDLASSSDEVAAVGSASTTLETLLSYDYTTFDKHVAQVEPQLAAPFLDQFTGTASATLKALATTNQTVVQAKVYDVGVMDTTSDSVRVLAYVNQATTTKAQPDPQIDQNRVIATMTRRGTRWLVSDLQAF